MKNKNILARFFSHNITLLVLSVILAFSTWFIINASSETDSNVPISGIPVTIELSETAQQDGLQVFNGNDLTASVEVSGNRVTVGSLSSSDIQIVANQTSSIISPGTYTLPLSAKKTGLKTNYSIVSSVTPSSVTVYVDRLKEAEFQIENRMTIQLADSNHYASTSLSHNTVTLSGPETQINKIKSVAVVDTITADSADKQTFQERIKYLDEDDSILELPLVTADVEAIEATVSVMPVMTVNLAIDTVGAPTKYPSIQLTPSKIKIAGPQSKLDQIENQTIVTGTLDFSKMTNKINKELFDISVPTGCKVISGESSVTAIVNLSGYVKTDVSAKISCIVDTTKYIPELNNNNVAITVYGPESLLESITASDISVIADLTDMVEGVSANNPTVSFTVPLTVKLSSKFAAQCWVYGSYDTTVTVTLK